MNLTYTKKSTGKIYKSPEISHQASAYPLGDGDCMRTCRLCGGEKNLKHFQDTYVWEGNEERYDDLLYECFGIKVTPTDCMICDYCVRGLRSMEKFKALVFAAFKSDINTNDQATPASSSNKVAITNCCQTSTGKYKLKKPILNQGQQTKQKHLLEGARKKETIKKWMHPDVKYKRVQCEVCKQRYPLLASHTDKLPFICSRCKTMAPKSIKKPVPSNAYKAMHLYNEAGHRRRTPRLVQNKAQVSSNFPKRTETKHQNATYLKKNNTVQEDTSDVVKTVSFTNGVSDDNYFYITSEEDVTPQNTPQVNPEKNPSLKFIFKKTSSRTKNTPK